ncbi:MAG: DNA-3-methyladenine glycosylase family protein [Lentihominibacter sp.]
MKIIETNGILEIRGVEDFDLDHIFDCGQCFRWERNCDGSYTGIAYGRIVTMDYDKDEHILKLYNSNREDFDNIWRNYLDLDRDYSAIKKKLKAADTVICQAIDYGHGIRILNQNKWETLISFIISQNNNIPRIKKNINSLAELMGDKAGEYNGKVYFNLPDPQTLASASIEDLGPCRLGYRAKYLIETAGQVAEDGMDSLEYLGEADVSAAEALESLRRYCGVGPKVANCIALFSMGKIDSFPIDTWVRKVMNQLYNIPENEMKKMAAFAAETFGEYGGIAQQYLFYYITHNGK